VTDYTELINKIIDHLKNDRGCVTLTTYGHQWEYYKKHADFFRVGADGSPLVRQGKHWNNISGCAIRFYSWKL
jgi:hypothetical protein